MLRYAVTLNFDPMTLTVETDPRILLSHFHVRSVLIRKLVVTDRHRMMMTEIAPIEITEIVTAVDVVNAGDPDGNASLL